MAMASPVTVQNDDPITSSRGGTREFSWPLSVGSRSAPRRPDLHKHAYRPAWVARIYHTPLEELRGSEWM